MISYPHITHKKINNKNSQVIFSYTGNLGCNEINWVIKSIETQLYRNVRSRTFRKKLFNLLIETTQNLYNYLKKAEIEDKRGVYIFALQEGGDYKVMTGNFLVSDEINGIRSRIEMVNALTQEELKALYRGVLEIGATTEQGGAGLGLIDIARKSGKKLSYDFDEIDDKFSFFTLEISFSNN